MLPNPGEFHWRANGEHHMWQPEAIADLSMRYGGIRWGHGRLALLTEYWWKTRQLREWRLFPDTGDAPALLREGSYEDRYADPGSPVMQPDDRGFARLLTTGPGGLVIYRIGAGASPEGDRPFLDRQDLAGGGTERLFQSRAPWYEAPIALLDAGAVLAFGSDWFVAPMEPLMSIYAAATRRTLDGASQ